MPGGGFPTTDPVNTRSPPACAVAGTDPMMAQSGAGVGVGLGVGLRVGLGVAAGAVGSAVVASVGSGVAIPTTDGPTVGVDDGLPELACSEAAASSVALAVPRVSKDAPGAPVPQLTAVRPTTRIAAISDLGASPMTAGYGGDVAVAEARHSQHRCDGAYPYIARALAQLMNPRLTVITAATTAHMRSQSPRARSP